jgi:hypothetical protein
MNLETIAGRKWRPPSVFMAMSETNVEGKNKKSPWSSKYQIEPVTFPA